jgi:hypothetical protein
MKMRVQSVSGDWVSMPGRFEAAIAKAATGAMHDVGKIAQTEARANIAAAGFGSAWQKSIKIINYPKRGISLNPEVWFHSSINFSDVFEFGKTISGGTGLVWLPLPSVPMWPTNSSGYPPRQMSPKKFIELVGPLRTMSRPGKPPMLGLVVRGVAGKAQPFGRFVSSRSLKSGAKRKTGGVEVIPMFVGVSSVTLKKRFDVYAQVKKAVDLLPELYIKNLEEVPE